MIIFSQNKKFLFRFLTSSPDQRRAEATGPDGITRGSYSYLDDKGVQRTVQYIAGAGIGYKVLQSTVGPGTHVSANADVPEYSVKAVSNEIAISDGDPTGGGYPTGPDAPTGPDYVSSTVPPYTASTTPYPPPSSTYPTPTTYAPPTPYPSQTYPPSSPYPPPPYPPSAFSTTNPYTGTFSTPRPFSRPSQEQVFISTPSSSGGIDRHHPQSTVSTFPSGGPSPLAPSAPTGSGENDIIYGLLPPREGHFHSHPPPPLPTPSSAPLVHITPSPSPTIHITPSYPPPFHVTTQQPHPSPPIHITPSYPPPALFYPAPTYLPTAEEQSPRPFSSPGIPGPPYQAPGIPGPPYQVHPTANRYPVDAVIKNTSNGWFYGIPPGAAVRAHIQNIDLVPNHDRALSPSEALRLDEERDAILHRNSHPRV